MHPNAQTPGRLLLTAFGHSSTTPPQWLLVMRLTPSLIDEAFSPQRPATRFGGMWRMLCTATQKSGAAALEVEFSGIEADAKGGKAHREVRLPVQCHGAQGAQTSSTAPSPHARRLIATHRDLVQLSAGAAGNLRTRAAAPLPSLKRKGGVRRGGEFEEVWRSRTCTDWRTRPATQTVRRCKAIAGCGAQRLRSAGGARHCDLCHCMDCPVFRVPHSAPTSWAPAAGFLISPKRHTNVPRRQQPAADRRALASATSAEVSAVAFARPTIRRPIPLRLRNHHAKARAATP